MDARAQKTGALVAATVSTDTRKSIAASKTPPHTLLQAPLSGSMAAAVRTSSPKTRLPVTAFWPR